MVIGSMFGVLVGGIESMMRIMIVGLFFASVAFIMFTSKAIDVLAKIALRLADLSVSNK